VKRIIVGLVSAERSETSPWPGIRRPRGAKRLGCKYEKELARALDASWEFGPWFRFEDRNGGGFCQPDFIRVTPSHVVVLEAKHTWSTGAHDELRTLYEPVLRCVYGRPVVGVVVAKKLRVGMTGYKISGDLGEAIENAPRSVWHWIGGSRVETHYPILGIRASCQIASDGL